MPPAHPPLIPLITLDGLRLVSYMNDNLRPPHPPDLSLSGNRLPHEARSRSRSRRRDQATVAPAASAGPAVLETEHLRQSVIQALESKLRTTEEDPKVLVAHITWLSI